MAIIEVADLVKEFRRPARREGKFGGVRSLFSREQIVQRAVDGVSFTVGAGEMVGYLGPNGAGKSTTVKMLTGILVPTSGTVLVNGLEPWRRRTRNARTIGVVFGQRTQLWWDLPLRDSLSLVGRIYGVDRTRFARNLATLTDLLDLGPMLNTPVRQLSLGQRMRGDLAAAMIYDPRILYLDEPTVGLDIVAKKRIRSFVTERNRNDGTTVILTTHDMDDVEQLCDRVILIDHGRTAYDGSVAQLKATYAPYREIVVTTADDVRVPGTKTFRDAEGRVVIRFDPRLHNPGHVVRQVVNDYHVAEIAVGGPDLEGVIQRIYSER